MNLWSKPRVRFKMGKVGESDRAGRSTLTVFQRDSQSERRTFRVGGKWEGLRTEGKTGQ
jgi:hypothetical protein